MQRNLIPMLEVQVVTQSPLIKLLQKIAVVQQTANK